jgi:lipoprotein-anchoring transpeptidase ErfK/SrfK
VLSRLTIVASLALFGCKAEPKTIAPPDAPSKGASAPEETPAEIEARAAAERAARVGLARAAFDAGAWDGGELYAATIRTSVMSAPAWPDDADGGADTSADGAHRLGYLRHGSHAPFFPEPIINDDCAEGWYELIEGGFVCGKYTSPDPRAPSIKFAANPPNLADPMPYKYGYSVTDNTPVYRRVLSLLDRQKFEPELIPPPPAADAGDAGPAPSDDTTDTPSDDTAPEHAAPKSKHAAKDAGAIVKLGDLKGRGVLVRRMMKGFYVALDRAFNAAHARWWRTAEGFAIPFERIALQAWSPGFHGSWVKVADAASVDGGDEHAEAPEGNGSAALVSSGYAARFVLNDKGKMGFTTALPKWTALELAGEPKTIDGVIFEETTSGFWVRVADLMIATPEPPPDLADGEKWIDVDLGRQFLVAFEGKHPVYATRVSSGRRTSWDPEHDHPTPTGTFRIYEKHISTTMDGDVAADGPYSIEDVPWVMYFQGSYALHGAFWHNFFGTTRSHGCVNMSPIDAREIFFWTEPTLPKGWHGVFQTAGRPGTRVVIHEPPDAKKARRDGQ